MKFAFISGIASTFAWQRLRDEGHEVGVFNAEERSPRVGEGMFQLFKSLPQLVAWGGDRALYVFDATSMKNITVPMGKTADALRKSGKLVLCGGTFMEKLESDRKLGQNMAKEVGFSIPVSTQFSSISTTIKWLEKQDPEKEFYFKTDEYVASSLTYGGEAEDLIRHLEYVKGKYKDKLENHLEEKIEGVPMSTMGWYTKGQFLHHLCTTLEHKKFMAQELGMATGCSLNLCFIHHETHERIRPHYEKLAKLFEKLEAPPGMYDCNCVFTEDKEYFLEWTPRFGYDSEPTSFPLINDLGRFFLEVATGTAEQADYRTDEAGYGIRLSVPPYPYEKIAKEDTGAEGVPVDGIPEESNQGFAPYNIRKGEGGYELAEPSGLLGVAIATGTNVTEMNKECIDFARTLVVPDLQWREDGDVVIKKDLENLKKVGVKLPPWLT